MHSAMSSQQTQGAGAPDEPEAVSRDDNNDVALALALAQAARAVEYVVDLGAGRYGAAVTYGPGQRIMGIVLRQPAQSADSAAPAFVAEAHIIVATAAVTRVMTTPATRQSKRRLSPDHALSSSEAPVLLRIAAEARHALAATLRQLRPNEQWDIDITIDDLRDTNAGVSSGAQ